MIGRAERAEDEQHRDDGHILEEQDGGAGGKCISRAVRFPGDHTRSSCIPSAFEA
jgi:hypothetical protein